MNLFDRNRNELSRYFYDLSKAVLVSYIALPIFQKNFTFELGLAGSLPAVILLGIGIILRKK
jgi:hypothetical protein